MALGIWGYAIIALLPVAALLIGCLQKGDSHFRWFLRISLLFSASLLLGQSLYFCTELSFQNEMIGDMPLSGESIEVILTGRVKEVKTKSSGSVEMILDELEYQKAGETFLYHKKNGCKVVVKDDSLLPDDRVRITGKLSDIMPATNPGEYDSSVYYKAKGVQFELYADHLDVIDRPQFSIRAWAYRISRRIATVLETEFDEEDSALLKAMVLGDRSDLKEEIKRPYEENGLAHLLAVSGLHVSIVGGRIFSRLRKRKYGFFASSFAGFVILLFYGIMTGFGSSVTRAVLMYIIYLFSQVTGREYDLISSMCLSGIFMLAEYPFRIREGGFLISFTCVFVIGLVLPCVEKIIKNYTENKLIIQVIQSIVIGIFTAPMIMQIFYEISPFSPLLNLIVIPAMSPLMISGILTGLCGLLLFDIRNVLTVALLREVIKLPAMIVLRVFKTVLRLSSSLPGNRIVTGCPGVFRTILMYVLLGTVLYMLYHKITLNFHILCIAFAIYTISWCVTVDKGISVTMLDVGQGECLLMQKNGINILVDGGSTSANKVGKYIIQPVMKYYGITHLDYVLVSHEDEDHINGLMELIDDGFPMDHVIFSDASGEEGSLYQKIKQHSEIQMICTKRGEGFRCNDLSFFCLHPAGDSMMDINNNSLVYLIKDGDFSMMLTGDIEVTGETEMLKYIHCHKEQWDKICDPGGIDVLKIAHHGSSGSGCKDFLKLCQPKVALISAGRHNIYGHPHKETLNRLQSLGISVFRTDMNGAIELKTKGDSDDIIIRPFQIQ